MSMKNIIIYTDLDGTLLEHKTYSFDDASEALRLVRMKKIPLIIVSSKTRAEIEYYRKRLQNNDPFVSENGGGIFIPSDYHLDIPLPEGAEKINGYYLIKIGTEYSKLREMLKKLQRESFNVKGFGDMTEEELARLTSLPPHEASLCKKREFDEPFVFYGSEEELNALIERIKKHGYNYTAGVYHHITGNNDKGKAVEILTTLYKSLFKNILTVGLGDSLNDLEMLKKVDIPVVIKKPDGSYDNELLKIEGIIRTDEPGPKGWQQAIKKILNMV